jgi:hypothetical protein
MVTLIVISMGGCEVNNPDSTSLRLVSFKDNGCHSRGSKIEDDVILNWDYKPGKLKLEFLFSTHCSASCKDSVLIEGNILNIFLADTNQYGAKCLCPLKEEFEFEITGYKQVQILFSYKAFSQTEYFLLLDKSIEL